MEGLTHNQILDEQIDSKSGRLTQEHMDNCTGCPLCEE